MIPINSHRLFCCDTYKKRPTIDAGRAFVETPKIRPMKSSHHCPDRLLVVYDQPIFRSLPKSSWEPHVRLGEANAAHARPERYLCYCRGVGKNTHPPDPEGLENLLRLVLYVPLRVFIKISKEGRKTCKSYALPLFVFGTKIRMVTFGIEEMGLRGPN